MTKSAGWLDNSLELPSPSPTLRLSIVPLTTISRNIGAMLASILVLVYLQFGTEYHLPRSALFLFYAIVGWQYVKYLKFWQVAEDSTFQSLLWRAFLNAIVWTVLCFAVTIVMREDLWWTPTLEVFAYIFTVVLTSDVFVWTTRLVWRSVSSKLSELRS